MLLPALAGWPFFWKRNRMDAVIILVLSVTLLLVIAGFSNWHGIFGDGPRYLLPVLPLLSLPLVSLLNRIAALGRPAVLPLARFGMTVAAVLLVALQFNAVALHPLAIHNCRLFFRALHVYEAEQYYDRLLHPGLHTRDLMRWDISGEGYPPWDALRLRGEPGDHHFLKVAIDVLDGMLLPNLLLYDPPQWQSADTIVAREMRGLRLDDVFSPQDQNEVIE